MRASRGFTLIELLLALALAGIVITVSYAVLVGTIKARNEASEQIRWARIQASVFDILIEDLTQATRPVVLEKLKDIDPNPPANGGTPAPGDETAPPGDGTNPPAPGDETAPPNDQTATADGPTFMPFFLAESSPEFSDKGGVAFVIARPGYDSDAEQYFLYREVAYFVKRDSRTNAWLLYRREQTGWDGDMAKGGTAELVCDMIGDFKVEYYDGLDWLDEWVIEERVELPNAVRIKLSFYFQRDAKGLPITTEPPKEFYTVVSLRNSRYFNPEDRDRMIREGLIEQDEVIF